MTQARCGYDMNCVCSRDNYDYLCTAVNIDRK